MAKLISSWSNNLETIPTNYIMPPERRPGNFLPVSTDIPVIDLSLTENQDRRPDLVLQILKAGHEFGLFQVINHGVSEETIQDAKGLYKELFNMSIEDKARLYSEDFTKTCRLYTSRSESNKIDSNHWRDTLQHQCYPLEQHISSWPEKPAQYRHVSVRLAERYAVEVRKLGLRILDLIGEGLGIQQGYFEGGSGLTERQTMSINYYPPCPDPSLAMGIAAHSDPNLITLLHQDVAGLQVLKDEQWVGVEALPNAFVVNGGCQLQLCHEDESSALLQFKQRISISNSSSKVISWNLDGERNDCCSWDGVECEMDTGHVVSLDLSSSFLSGPINSTSTLFNLVNLRKLNLANNHFNFSEIPSRIANLSMMSSLNLSSSMFSGKLPASLGSLTKLTSLDLSKNQLQGEIPSSFSQLKNLDYLDLSFNKLNGSVHVNLFLNLKNLSQLMLSHNTITLLTNNTKNTSLPMFKFLGLGLCNLSEFPEFLRFQEKLEVLSLVKNKIQQIPKWMRNGGMDNHRNTPEWEQQPVVLPWAELRIFDLRDNMLHGTFPLPPPNIYGYSVANNRLNGEIPSIICKRKSLYILDLSNNTMSGPIPPCLSNFSDSLTVLNLKGNNFCGTIPQPYTNGCNLMMIDLSQNQLRGQVPRSMANCRNLEIINIGENQIHDDFPDWLGTLPELQVLILASNNFNGVITSPPINLKFPKLRIMDLSYNAFIGSLQLEFSNWNAMKIAKTKRQTYMASNASVQVEDTMWRASFAYSMMITNKGVKREYEKILSIFTALDLSSNKFSGEISETIGSLQGLHLLNISNNELTGGIPTSMGNLTQLEALDLSRNKLSGEIPQQLQQLSFLAFLNVSYNRLIGPIPKGNQFNTFQNNTYMGNLALCGDPLSKKCGKLEGPSSSPATIDGTDDSEFPSGVDWVVIFAGVGSGLVVGLILGHNLTTRYHEWFVEKVEKMTKKRKITFLLWRKRNE